MPEVVFVGTSDAFGSGGRRQSAILVRAPQGAVLLDCGPTTGTGLAALGIEADEIDAILISHFHGDHFAGIPQFLIASLYQEHRTRPLLVAGPRGVEARVRGAAAALGHPMEATRWPFTVEFEELPPGARRAVGPVGAESYPTHHQPESHPLGLKLDCGGRRLVYSGDTGWFDELPRAVGAADLLISECTLLQRGFEFHLSYEELLEHRTRFHCERIVLTHFGRDMSPRRGRIDFETADDGTRLVL